MTRTWTTIASILLIPFTAFHVLSYISADKAWLGNLLGTIPCVVRLHSPAPRITTGRNVTYVGGALNKVEQFLNIFYAEDTSGHNRFATPVPFVPESDSIIDATRSGTWCPQGTGAPPLPFTSPITNISENCLSLGITRPLSIKQDARLPVLAWVHGGGHALGSHADQLYRPEGLVTQSIANKQPVIFVGINYRLGVFGFAKSKPLSKAGHTNAGLRDQRLAFQWIRDNIAAFGGDPNNVVSVGQSVGAADTGLHLTSYGGKKGVPFHKAIMMSGGPNLIFNIKSDLVDNNTAAVADALDCVGEKGSQSPETLKCLRNVPMEQLMNVSVSASRAARPPFGEGFFYPTYDGDYIPDRPSELLRQGKFVKDVPVIASWVTNDGAWYASPTTTTDEDVTRSFTTWLFDLSNSTLAKILALYPLDDFAHMVRPDVDGAISPQYYRAAQINRDLWFTCPVLDFAMQHSRHSQSAMDNIYIYEHNATKFTPAFNEIMGVPFWRVSHLSDIPYLLDNNVTIGGDNSESQRALSQALSSAAIRFAYKGQPGTDWPEAFDKKEVRSGIPKSLSFFLSGGENGNGAVTVERNGTSDGVRNDEREAAVYWEKLFARCDFINSETVRQEMGV